MDSPPKPQDKAEDKPSAEKKSKVASGTSKSAPPSLSTSEGLLAQESRPDSDSPPNEGSADTRPVFDDTQVLPLSGIARVQASAAAGGRSPPKATGTSLQRSETQKSAASAISNPSSGEHSSFVTEQLGSSESGTVSSNWDYIPQKPTPGTTVQQQVKKTSGATISSAVSTLDPSSSETPDSSGSVDSATDSQKNFAQSLVFKISDKNPKTYSQGQNVSNPNLLGPDVSPLPSGQVSPRSAGQSTPLFGGRPSAFVELALHQAGSNRNLQQSADQQRERADQGPASPAPQAAEPQTDQSCIGRAAAAVSTAIVEACRFCGSRFANCCPNRNRQQ